MAGGIFKNQPFVLNEKCIIFSILCMTLFLYKPTFPNEYFKYAILFVIFILAYVAMAWYDYIFDCQIAPLKRSDGRFSITQLFKPPAYSKKQVTIAETDNDKKVINILVYLSHILLIVPLLFYISYYKHKINPMVYPILGSLAVFTLLYHGVRLITISH